MYFSLSRFFNKGSRVSSRRLPVEINQSVDFNHSSVRNFRASALLDLGSGIGLNRFAKTPSRILGFEKWFHAFISVKIAISQLFTPHFFKSILLFFAFIWLTASAASAQNYTFSNERADWYFERCNAKQKCIFLCNLMQADCENLGVVDIWVKNKIENWTSLLEEVTETDLEYLLHDKFIIISDQFIIPLCTRIIAQWQFSQPYKKVLASAAYFMILEELDFGSTENTKTWFSILERVLIVNSDGKYKLWYLRLLGIALEKQGEISKALDAYHQSLQYANGKYNADKLMVLSSLGISYYRLENYHRAKHYILKVLSNRRSPDIPIGSLNTYGNIQEALGKYDEALSIHTFVLHHATKRNQFIYALISYSNISKVYFAKKEYKKAHFYLNKSDELCRKLGLQYALDFNKIARANVFLEQKKYKEAFLEVKNLETDIRSYDDANLLKNFYKIMYHTQLELEQVFKAKHYFEQYLIYEGKTFGKELNFQLGEQDMENQKIANAAILVKLEQKRLKDFYIKVALGFALSGLIALVLIIIISSAKKRDRIRLEGIIEKNNLVKASEAKSKELITESIKNLSIDAVKENIKTDLELLVDELPERQRELFKPFLKQLSKNERSQYIEEFEARFLGVYESFYDKLRELIPDLSPAEAKFCAFIKLNFSTKEISFITNRSTRTIDNTRSRIRKKLGIETDVNLHTFLADL